MHGYHGSRYESRRLHVPILILWASWALIKYNRAPCRAGGYCTRTEIEQRLYQRDKGPNQCAATWRFESWKPRSDPVNCRQRGKQTRFIGNDILFSLDGNSVKDVVIQYCQDRIIWFLVSSYDHLWYSLAPKACSTPSSTFLQVWATHCHTKERQQN